jgi:hypothetical protein
MKIKAVSPYPLKVSFVILLCPLWLAALSFGQESKPLAPDDPLNSRVVRIETDHAALTLFADKNGRLYQLGFGARSDEFYPQWGDGFIAEPALEATHADGNTSTDLLYVRHGSKPEGDGITLTRIEMKDPAYPFFDGDFSQFGARPTLAQWKQAGAPSVGGDGKANPGPNLTFDGQSTCIFPVEGKPGVFIAMFDIWRPKNQTTSGYVWRPIVFGKNRFTIPWRDTWSLPQ